jgi:hypothetical protein
MEMRRILGGCMKRSAINGVRKAFVRGCAAEVTIDLGRENCVDGVPVASA